MDYPLIIDVDERHKITLLIQSGRLYFKAEFLMDTKVWVIKESYNLTKAQAGVIAFALLGKAEELEGPALKRPRRRGGL